jgi:hypothetical protein
MTEQAHRGWAHRPGAAIVFTGASLVACTISLQWSWNTVASGLFSLPIMQFKHALGFTLFLVVIFFIFNVTTRVFLGGPGHLMNGGQV